MVLASSSLGSSLYTATKYTCVEEDNFRKFVIVPYHG